MNQAEPKDNRKNAAWLIGSLAFFLGLCIIDLINNLAGLDKAIGGIAGEVHEGSVFWGTIRVFLLAGGGAVFCFTVCWWLIWQRENLENIRRMGFPARFSSDWGMNMWFLPLLNFFFPLRVMRSSIRRPYLAMRTFGEESPNAGKEEKALLQTANWWWGWWVSTLILTALVGYKGFFYSGQFSAGLHAMTSIMFVSLTAVTLILVTRLARLEATSFHAWKDWVYEEDLPGTSMPDGMEAGSASWYKEPGHAGIFADEDRIFVDQ